MDRSANDIAAGGPPYAPRRPLLCASAIMSLWVGILSLPMLAGNFLATDLNDQYDTGYAFREWAVTQWKALGHFPLWNPEIMGGLPFVGAMHGDLFYPTAWLRLVFPIHVAMNLGFVIHYLLAGLFTYGFLRLWRVTWSGAVLGGIAYQLSGIVGSYVSPGHDGKLFVTALLPLGFIALTLAIRDRRWEGYSLFALAVGLALLSPHPQMAQYLLIAAGIYALYLSFGERAPPHTLGRRLVPLALALAAVALGVGIAAIQLLPFYAYIPYSPRDPTALNSFAWSTTYAIPWEHLPEFVLSRFTGETFSNAGYWGPNGLKLHSEYLGLPVIALAVLGVTRGSRPRLAVWLSGIGLLFLLLSLGGETPFYRLWWSVVPFARSMRAVGMAFYVVAFVVAVLAGLGLEVIERSKGGKHAVAWLITGGTVVTLGLAGVFGMVAEALALNVERTLNMPAIRAAAAAHDTIRWGAVASGMALLLAGGAALGFARRKLTPAVLGWTLVAVVGTDLWLNARPFWNYSRPQETVFERDEIKDYLNALPRPFRVWDVGVYGGSALMADQIAQWYGHHGNELHAFDVLNGRQGQSLTFANAGDPQLINLYAIRYIIVETARVLDSIPGMERVLHGVRTSTGKTASLLRVLNAPSYARMVPYGLKLDFAQTVTTVLDQRFPTGQIVLIDQDAPVHPEPIPDPLPPPADAAVHVVDWEPGRMRIELPQGAPTDGYLLISENYYVDWTASVDGSATPTFRGDASLLTVAIPAGTRVVVLEFRSKSFEAGRLLSLLSAGLTLLGIVVPLSISSKQA